YLRRTCQRAPRAVRRCARGLALQSGRQSLLRATLGRRQTQEGRAGGLHAQAAHHAQRNRPHQDTLAFGLRLDLIQRCSRWLLWKRGAVLGVSEAQWHLGAAYAKGQGTERNYAMAYAWFRCAITNAES